MADYGAYHEFVSRFVGPLVMGGRVEVRAPVGPGVLGAWENPPDLDATLVTRIADTARAHLAKIGPVGSITGLPLDALALALAWHNLLAMTHPEVRARRGLRRKTRQWCAAMIEWAGEAHTRGEVAMRHGLLHGLTRLRRVDTHVEFWAGYADFVGVAPPSSLVAWPKLRRVQERRTSVPLFELLGALELDEQDDDDDLTTVARAALALSPLTDFETADRPPAMAFAWTAPGLNVLADDALRGAAQRVLLARGTSALRAVEQATLAAVKREELPEACARWLLRFHLETLLTEALSARPTAPETRPQSAAPEKPAAQGTAASQPLATDAAHRLGHARVARWTHMPIEVVQRALPVDPNRPMPKDSPSVALLQRAKALEVRT